MSSQIDRSAGSSRRTRLVGAVLVAFVAVLGMPTAANAAPATPTVHIVDGGDAFLNASEIGSVMLEGTYDPSTSTEVIARITNDATCDAAASGTPTLAATLDPGAGTWTAGPFDLSDDTLFAQGDVVCARARASDGTTQSDAALSDNLPAKDTVAPLAGTASISDGDGFIDGSEVDTGVPVDWANADLDATSATVWFEQSATIPAGCGSWTVGSTGTGSLDQACATSLAEGSFSFKATWADLAGNVSAEAEAVSIKDTVAPLVSVAIQDGDGLITLAEAQAGVPVDYEITEDGPAVTLSVAPLSGPAPDACVFADQPRGPATLTVTDSCFSVLGHGTIVVTLEGADAVGHEASGSDQSDLRKHAGTIATVIQGAIDDAETGHVDTVLNAAETANGTALTTRLDLSDEIEGVVKGRVAVRDASGAVVSAQKNMEATGSEESRTIVLDVTSLEQGPIRVVSRIIDSTGSQTVQVTHLTLDLGGPETTWATEDGASFLTVAPVFFSTSTVSFSGTTGDPAGLSGVQWVYLVGKERGGKREWGRHATLASREAPMTEWELKFPLPPGEWEVTARSQDTAGNVDLGPSIRVVVRGL